ncbi:biliverdin-producing heme oxygenase [Cerasicoccus frondis]|uniref:biliverdin-producing heme oxygenase n=1 Tax=Cerasicoccus frondis TaxID=490090 RepID=UPI0028525C25|nr:biliverdin-producing heme oxygenase [Cerasicoccus frondis]
MPITQSASDQFTQLVRQRTRKSHDELEHIMSARLSCSELTVYRQWLLELFSVWAPLEQCLHDSSLFSEHPYLKLLLRSERLQEDLGVLFGDDFKAEGVRYADFSEIKSTPASLYGLAYVWAGSIHGAQVLAQRLRNGLSLTASTGGSFFMLDDPQACRAALMRFYGWLDENLSAVEASSAVESAQQTYQIFLDWYQRP